MGKSTTATSQSLLALLDEHNATNAAIKITAVAIERLVASPPEDGKEFARAMAGWVKSVHASWGPTQFTRSRVPKATDWMTGAALVRAVASFEAYTETLATTLNASPTTDEAQNTDKTCLAVRNALAASVELGVATDEVIDLCEVLNWFAAIRNAVCHGNRKIISTRQANAQHAWSRVHNYFGFADKADVPDFPKEVSVTWPVVLFASACGYRIAQRLDAPACSRHGTSW